MILRLPVTKKTWKLFWNIIFFIIESPIIVSLIVIESVEKFMNDFRIKFSDEDDTK